jgi:hypothetical protein
MKTNIKLKIKCSLALLFALGYCNAQKQINTICMQPVDTIEIKLPTPHYKGDKSTQYYIDRENNGYFVFYHAMTGKLFVWDMRDSTKSYSVEMDLTGMVPDINGFYVHNLDSIFATDISNTLFLYNRQGKQINKYRVEIPIELRKYYTLSFFRPDGLNMNPVLVRNNTLYMFCYADIGYEDEDTKTLPVGICIDMLSGKTQFIADSPLAYHKNMKGEYYRNVYSTIVPEENLLVYGFPASHTLNVFNEENSSMKEIPAASSLVRTISGNRSGNQNKYSRKEYEMHYMKNDSYHRIIYDPYRKVYYRFAELKDENFMPADSFIHTYQRQEYFNKERSIVILDKNMNFLCEYLLNGKNQIPQNSFVDEKGLYIRLWDEDDDTMKFVCFLLSKM